MNLDYFEAVVLLAMTPLVVFVAYCKGYTKGTFNWQAGFGVIYTDRKRVLPIAVPIEKDGSFQFEGKVYG